MKTHFYFLLFLNHEIHYDFFLSNKIVIHLIQISSPLPEENNQIFFDLGGIFPLFWLGGETNLFWIRLCGAISRVRGFRLTRPVLD